MTNYRSSATAVVVGTLLAAVGAQAAENADDVPHLEEVLITGQLSRYSALKSDTPIMETARSVTIETQLDMQIKGVMTLDDSFTYSAGVYGKTYGYATRGDWLKVRGLDVPLYRDSLQSLFGNYNNTRPHVYTLDQVEILKGPTSVLYGKGSPGGIVNVVSKLPQDEQAHEVVAEVGSFNRKQIAFDSTGRIGGNGNWLYRLVGVYLDSDTQVDYVEDNTRVFAPSISWRPSDDTDVTLLVNHSQTDGDTGAQFLPIYGTLRPAPNGEFIENDTYMGEPEFNRYDTRATAVTLLAEHEFNRVWSLELTSRYTDAEADYQQAWPSFIGGDRYVYNDDGSLYEGGTVPRTFYRQDATSEQAAVDVRLRANFDTGSLGHQVLMGAQYQDVTLDDAGYYLFALGYDAVAGGPDDQFGDAYWLNVFDPVYGNVPPESFLESQYTQNPGSTTQDLGLYINDQISIGNWRVTAGLRFDNTETDTGSDAQEDEAVSTSVGALYQFDNGLAPYASYAESFEPVIGDDGAGNALEPQEGEQYEVGMKYQPSGFPAMVTLAWFDITQTNLNDPSSLVGTVEQQRGEAQITGLEVEGTASVGNFTIELNASKLDTESAEGFQLASVPEEQASTWVTWRSGGNREGIRAGGGIRYVGESFGGADTIRTPSYTLGDLMIGYLMDNWDFTLNARNVADKEFQATCIARGDCFPGEARNIIGRVRYTF